MNPPGKRGVFSFSAFILETVSGTSDDSTRSGTDRKSGSASIGSSISATDRRVSLNRTLPSDILYVQEMPIPGRTAESCASTAALASSKAFSSACFRINSRRRSCRRDAAASSISGRWESSRRMNLASSPPEYPERMTTLLSLCEILTVPPGYPPASRYIRYTALVSFTVRDW